MVELFFDRTVGKSIPEAMRMLGLSNVYHHHSNPKTVKDHPPGLRRSLFAQDVTDDVFLKFAGRRGWFVIGQDYSYHLDKQILAAIRDHNVGVFYIWGANSKKWDTMRFIARHYDKIVETAESTERPFIYKIGYAGRIKRIL